MPIVSDLRALPKAPESERWILGCVLTFEDSHPNVFSQLNAHDFFDPTYQTVFVAMHELYRASGCLDTTLLVAKLKQPPSGYPCDASAYDLLEMAQEVATSAGLEAHIQRLRQASAGRALCLTVNDAARRVIGGTSASEVLPTLLNDLSQFQRAHQPAAKLVTAASIEARETEWIWPGWLPAGALTIFDGDPGCGKTQVACDLAARLSYGRPLPFAGASDEARAASPQCTSQLAPRNSLLPHNVLMLTGEDSHDTTTRPRLEAAGADLERVWLWPDDDPIRLPSGVERLAATVAAHDIRLVVIDPITAYLDDAVNTNRDADVRRALRPLVSLAQHSGAAVLLVRHLNKDSSKAALYRGGGSIGFIAAARAAWVVARDPGRHDRFVLAMNKCNIARHPRSIAYEIEAHGGTSRVRWEAECDFAAGDLLAGKIRSDKQSQAEEIIRRLLEGGPRPEREVRQACREAGIGDTTYKNARQAVGAQAKKSAMAGGWQLEMPVVPLPVEGVVFPDTPSIVPFG